MSALLERQFLFASLAGKLLVFADAQGIKVTVGEVFRTPEQARWNAAHDLGTETSLHQVRLAIDLQAFQMKGGGWVYLDDGRAPEYTLLGNYWKGLHPDCRWGGDFQPDPDWDHYSITWQGRA